MDPSLRQRLFDYFLESATSTELSQWLRQLDLSPPRGSNEHKIGLLRENSGHFLEAPPEAFRELTLSFILRLLKYPADDLAAIAESVGASPLGPKDSLIRSIYREIGYREGWLPPKRPAEDFQLTLATILPFVHHWPVLRERDYEKDYYGDFWDEMTEILGEDNVHEQQVVAHGQALKIDFHLGRAMSDGVGVEFKLPTNNSEIQKTLGQVDQYKARYGSELLIVLFPHFLSNAQTQHLQDQLEQKKVTLAVKRRVNY